MRFDMIAFANERDLAIGRDVDVDEQEQSDQQESRDEVQQKIIHAAK